MKKILWLSDSPTTSTGYGVMTRNILNGLSDEYECHCIAHNYFGNTLSPYKFRDGTKNNFFLHGTGKAKYAVDMIKPIIDKEEIDYFGILLDTFMLMEANFLNIDTSPSKTFFYYPSDGGGTLPINCDQILKKVHVPIAMSKFGQLQAKKIHGIDAEYIPHAFDDKVYYPLSDKEKEKIRESWLMKNKFVVGVVARNQGRKMLDRTLKAFKIFCMNKPDAVLLLHCDPDDLAQSFSIKELINRLQLNNRVVFTGATFYKPFSEKEMNEIYNLMDVFLLSTSGEGFGVPIIEAMGCGIPQLVTDYTTTKELLVDDIQTGFPIKLVGTEVSPYPHHRELIEGTITGSWNVERAVMSIEDCANKLTQLYENKKLREEFSKNSIKKAKKYYTWGKVIPQWKKIIRRI